MQDGISHSYPKHVEKSNKHIKKICTPSWLYLQNNGIFVFGRTFEKIPVSHFMKIFNGILSLCTLQNHNILLTDMYDLRGIFKKIYAHQ